MGSSYRVICMEFGRKAHQFDSGSDLWLVINESNKREVQLDGIGVYDLVDRPDYWKVTAIVYELNVYELGGIGAFHEASTFRHDFKKDVHLLADEFPARLVCDTALFDLREASTVMDNKDLNGELPQFTA